MIFLIHVQNPTRGALFLNLSVKVALEKAESILSSFVRDKSGAVLIVFIKNII